MSWPITILEETTAKITLSVLRDSCAFLNLVAESIFRKHENIFCIFLNNRMGQIVDILHGERQGHIILHHQYHGRWWPGATVKKSSISQAMNPPIPVTIWFPWQRASNAVRVSMSVRYHENPARMSLMLIVWEWFWPEVHGVYSGCSSSDTLQGGSLCYHMWFPWPSMCIPCST